MMPNPLKDSTFRSACPINQMVEMIGDNWSMLIIRDMLFFHKISYGDFMNSPESISTNILAARLKQLECNGIIEKLTDSRDRKKKLYVLSASGLDLAPLLAEMILWGYKHGDSANIPVEYIDKLTNQRNETLDSTIKEYQSLKTGLIRTNAKTGQISS